MKTKIWMLAGLWISCMLPAQAIVIQKLTLKNGSELEGYISVQRPGNNLNFTTERADIIMDSRDVRSIVDHEVSYRDLSPAWIRWAEENDAFIGVGEKRVLTLSDIITTQDKSINRVRVIEKGAKTRYLELADNSYPLSWDTIAVLNVDKRLRTALTGIDRVYTLSSGMEYEGQYVEEVPGKTLSLYRDNGVIEVFDANQVVKYAMRKVNPNQTLFEQSPLLDGIMLKDNTVKRGIVIERNYSSAHSSDNYLLIQASDGTTQSIKIDDISEYRKEPNPAYAPLYDILLNADELVINRKEPIAVACRESSTSIALQYKDTLPHLSIKGNEKMIRIVLEYNLPIATANVPFQIVKIKEETKSKKTPTIYSFSFKELIDPAKAPKSVETSVNHTTKAVFEFLGVGLYAVYDPIRKVAYPMMIQSK